MTKKKKSILGWYFKTSLLVRIMTALILGAIAGIFFAHANIFGIEFWKLVEPLGIIFIRLLRMVVVPIVFFSLVVGTASVEPHRLGRIGGKIMGFYVFSTFVAAAVGLFFANFFNISDSVHLVAANSAAINTSVKAMSFKELILDIVPINIFNAFATVNMLQIIFFSILFGLALAFIKGSKKQELKAMGETVFNFFSGAAETMYVIVTWIMQYAPIGVFALIVGVFAENGIGALKPLFKYIGVLYLAFVLHFIFFYGAALRAVKLKLSKFITLAKTPILTAFVSRSSNGTLPVSLDAAEHQMGINRSVSSFTLPLGATVNMNGVAIQQCMSVFFIAGAAGLPLSFGQQILLLCVAVLSSVGAAGVPSGCMIMLIVVLETLGLPLSNGVVAAAYAMLLSIDPILDMGQTAINVSGDLVGTAIVAKTEPGEMDVSKWK